MCGNDHVLALGQFEEATINTRRLVEEEYTCEKDRRSPKPTHRQEAGYEMRMEKSNSQHPKVYYAHCRSLY
jgi:hypothetical protein